MSKRKNIGDDLTISLYNKKIRNDVVLISSREKAVVQAVGAYIIYAIYLKFQLSLCRNSRELNPYYKMF